MKVWLDPEGGWGPTRIWLTRLERLGYTVTEWREDGRSVLEITG